MDDNRTPRILTHDEQKAAEAAFGGRPFNPAWSASAKKVYDGLTRALPQSPVSDQLAENPVEPTLGFPGVQEPPFSSESPEATKPTELGDKIVAKRQEAIESGFLIDVTEDAKKVGLTFSVTITKPLWEVGIASSQELSDEARSNRLRDILMAFRLRLANQATLSPLIDFPALLALPPESVPQTVPLFALIQPDEQNRAMVTLLLPNEVSATIIPMN